LDSRIGEGTFGDVLRQGKIERTIFITVRPANDDESNNTNPLDQTSIIVGGVFHATRNTKSPWEMLRDSICGDIISTTSTTAFNNTTKKRKRKSKGKKKVSIDLSTDIQTEDNFEVPHPPTIITTYWDSAEANVLFGTSKPNESNAREAITTQMALLFNTSESHNGYLNLLNKVNVPEDVKLTEKQVFVVRNKILILIKCLQNALTLMELLEELLQESYN